MEQLEYELKNENKFKNKNSRSLNEPKNNSFFDDYAEKFE